MTLLALGGCTQYLAVNVAGGACVPPQAADTRSKSAITGVPQASGQGAGRGRQAVRITCPTGMTIDIAHDIEGQGGGSVSP